MQLIYKDKGCRLLRLRIVNMSINSKYKRNKKQASILYTIGHYLHDFHYIIPQPHHTGLTPNA